MERKIYIVRKDGYIKKIGDIFYFIVLYVFIQIPMSVNNIITRIQREILWGWGHKGRRMEWVKWENIFKTKEEGGLGIKDLECLTWLYCETGNGG